jgi:hypothetical protein
VIEGKESYEFEGFWYVAMNAFKKKTGEDLYSYIDYDTFVTNDENYPLLNFNWSPDEPTTMGKVCPILLKLLKYLSTPIKKRSSKCNFEDLFYIKISYASYINDLEI